jgi:hypothetical protein
LLPSTVVADVDPDTVTLMPAPRVDHPALDALDAPTTVPEMVAPCVVTGGTVLGGEAACDGALGDEVSWLPQAINAMIEPATAIRTAARASRIFMHPPRVAFTRTCSVS